jgi:hypothetical protein
MSVAETRARIAAASGSAHGSIRYRVNDSLARERDV